MKIWEGGTKDEIQISNEALFKGVSTLFGLRIVSQSKIGISSFVPPSQIFVRGADPEIPDYKMLILAGNVV